MLFELIKGIWGTLVALIRLLSLAIVFLINGIHSILFNRAEIIGMTMHAVPMNIERDKIAYIDNLCKNNIDLACGTVPRADDLGNAPFRTDDEYDDDDIWIDEDGEDFPGEGENNDGK